MINEFEVQVIYADTDPMGIVYHGRYIEFLERGRTEYMEQLGYPCSRLGEDGIWLPVLDISVKYKSPAKLYDTIVVRTIMSRIKGATIEMKYQIVNKDTGQICVEGKSTHPITDTELNPIRFKRVMPELYELAKKNQEEHFPSYKSE